MICLLSCKICGLLYVGSTTDRFRLRWNVYKDNGWKAQRGKEHMQPGLFEHFYSEEHIGVLQDCCIAFFDETDRSDPTIRE